MAEGKLGEPGFSERSCAPLAEGHLARLYAIAEADHAVFAARRPEYLDRRVAVTLAQGRRRTTSTAVPG
ncbi:hypothetical protein V5P93_004276 [Actinokineospora auranticolor]|uniref:Uncharacterized protein n=1 Tax=Actinokineospora auranticolor TaxID=155976 RepID=A0A2S6GID2_9PSEU|nr:hypothetical protein [Actinokineospora auranticolor]PPK64979.1 hypothetical protein CLV40_11621 [Actinokineospora auranticolor]